METEKVRECPTDEDSDAEGCSRMDLDHSVLDIVSLVARVESVVQARLGLVAVMDSSRVASMDLVTDGLSDLSCSRVVLFTTTRVALREAAWECVNEMVLEGLVELLGEPVKEMHTPCNRNGSPPRRQPAASEVLVTMKKDSMAPATLDDTSVAQALRCISSRKYSGSFPRCTHWYDSLGESEGNKEPTASKSILNVDSTSL